MADGTFPRPEVPLEIVEVRIPGTARPFACDGAGLALEVGEACLVETPRGPELAWVVRGPLARAEVNGLPRVLRRAAREDEETWTHRNGRDAQARAALAEAAAELKIALKPGRVDRSADGRRTVVQFTSEERVDLRSLARGAGERVADRIELRQVGARDEAACHGGCGACGRILCCASFMREFEPVSMKMAKVQGLSLAPGKISGVCGRLMCCLRYEYDGPPVKGGNGG